MPQMRLDKMLTHLGCGSRREVGDLVRAGRVSVNQAVCKDPARKVDPDGDSIAFDGQVWKYAKHRYYMLNKPAGIITATHDARQKTVLDLFPEPLRRDLFAVGRLDRDTEGLLLLTTDGAFGHSLMKPGKHVGKQYEAVVEGQPVADAQQQFARGLTLADGTVCLPADLQILQIGNPISRVKVTLYEGKYHQVKRMLHEVGCVVLGLRRLQIGSLPLDCTLASGEFRELTAGELKLLRTSDNAHIKK